MSGKGIPPWYMWGNSQTLTLESAGGLTISTSQLNRINYGRPETWHWLFVVTVVGGTIEPNNYECTVEFDVTVGIGRSSIKLPGFVVMSWSNLTPVVGSYGTVFRTTTAPGGFLDISLEEQRENLITELVAQDIQVNATAKFARLGAGDNRTLTIQIDSYWSPATHIRPEWFDKIGTFNGGEDHGS